MLWVFTEWGEFVVVGYKSRADEKSWNGANRKILEAEIAAHLLMFERIPNIYERVHKLGVRHIDSLFCNLKL